MAATSGHLSQHSCYVGFPVGLPVRPLTLNRVKSSLQLLISVDAKPSCLCFLTVTGSLDNLLLEDAWQEAAWLVMSFRWSYVFKIFYCHLVMALDQQGPLVLALLKVLSFYISPWSSGVHWGLHPTVSFLGLIVSKRCNSRDLM